MAKISRLRLREDANDGVWVPYALDIELCVARMPNPRYDAYIKKLQRPVLRQIREETLPDDQLQEIVREAMAHTVLTGWRNIQDDDGADVAYSPDRALAYFKDPEYADLLEFVHQHARKAANYRRAIQEDDEEN